MDPSFLGRIQCLNIDSQCVYGEEAADRLLAAGNTNLKTAFESGCSTKKGKMIRCCPLTLINKPYIPPASGTTIPIHVKQTSNQYNVCPTEITASCIRESPNNIPLCVAQKCNDAGYLEANNYYEVCKAYRPSTMSNIEDVPDCPEKNCPDMMQLPDWLKAELSGVSPSTSDLVVQPVPPNPTPPPTSPPPDNSSLQSIINKLPTSNDFYNWMSIIMGLIAFILILSIFSF